MIRVSGGYVSINPNFVISGIKFNAKIDDELYGVIAIIKNILLRGAPTKPSLFLQDNLGSCKIDGYKYTLPTKKLNWDKTIKGGLFDKPALTFYNRLTSECPEAFCFLPECPLNQIYYDTENKISDDVAVDFYSPFHSLTIEIDGPSHKQRTQKLSDYQRDNLIANEAGSNKPIRIKVEEFNNEETISKRIKDINDKMLESKIKDIAFISKSEITDSEKIYMYAFRIQMIILELISNGYIQLNNENVKLSITAENESDEVVKKAFNYAYSDLKLWFENLYALLNKTVEMPAISIENNSGIIVDIDIYNRYDDSDFQNEKIIKVRNDYFPYDKDSFAITERRIIDSKYEPSKYCQYKNYYHVETSDLRFHGVNEYNPSHQKSLEFFLKNIFGFEKFRPKQLEIVSEGMDPDNGIIGLLPTGSGKSACYQLVSFLTPGVTLIVSPLKLLMDDQKQNLLERNLIMSAYQIHSNQKENITVFENNQAKLLYISPERFFSEDFRELFDRRRIAQIVIDEVHCLSEWGHQFRTPYLLLFSFFKNSHLSKNVLLMGTSATASPRVVNDIKKEFSDIKENIKVVKSTHIRRAELTFKTIFVKSEIERDNIVYNIVSDNVKNDAKTVIFCTYPNDTEKISEKLNTFNAECYHGKLSNKDKDNAFKNFKSGKTKVLSATKAFGMGIDIPNIRQTIHYNIADSVESLYQEMGRAGRDGKKSYCTVLFWQDKNIQKNIYELFNEQLSIEKIKNGKKLSCYGDLQKPLFLLINTNKDHGSWRDFIYKGIYSFLNQENAPTEFDLLTLWNCMSDDLKRSNPLNETFKLNFERALYKLYTLGLINLWKVSYANGQTENCIYSGLRINDISLQEVQSHLEKYICKYDFKYQYDGKKEQPTIEDYILALCKWDNENFLHYRWESLKTLYNMIEKFVDSDTFANRIETFLMGSDKLEKTIINNNTYQEWISVFTETETDLLKDQLARYSAEYQNNEAIEFLQGMISFKNGESTREIMQKFRNIVSKHDDIEFVCDCLSCFEAGKEAQKRFLIFLADNFPKKFNNSKLEKYFLLFDETVAKELMQRPMYNAIYSSLEKLQHILGDNV